MTQRIDNRGNGDVIAVVNLGFINVECFQLGLVDLFAIEIYPCFGL